MPRPCVSRVLAIGDELLLGRTVDTNSAWLAQRLVDCGLVPDRLQAIGDAEDSIVATLRTAARGAQLIICTGGLGPTDDDRTRHALARAARVPLVSSAAAWRNVTSWYTRNRPGISVPETNRRQALLPRGARLLHNDRGTAPGILCRLGDAWVACLPGVPHEMRAMFDRLTRQLPQLIPGLRVPTVAEVWFAGIGESVAQEHLAGLLHESKPLVGITVSDLGHITLRAVGTPAQVRAHVKRLAKAIAPWRLPKAGIAPSLIARLTRLRQTIACAESVSGGHIAAQLTAVPGASAVVHATFVTYADATKARILGVDRALIRTHGAVSEAVALAMARGARKRARANIAVATTGIAGPGGGSKTLPVGTVFVAAANASRAVVKRLQIRGGRQHVQKRAAAEALLLAWQL